jgi:murein DD-endopeptidase MepM/ murein hydrolase activator NlpD
MPAGGTNVRAVESGKVAYSGMVDGSAKKTNYGNVIVIGHTPEADRNQRHVYSFYAHLDSRGVSRGHEVAKGGSSIGTSGNSGMRYYYMGKKKGYHLHFETIDSPRELQWGPGSFHGTSYRVDPMGRDYIGGTLIIDYGQATGEVSMSALSSRYGSIYRF